MSRPYAKPLKCECGNHYFVEIKRYAVSGLDMADDESHVACAWCLSVWVLEVNRWVLLRERGKI